ncbi:rhamnulokinase [Microbacterium nymphoidis]|uniref:rhamnulokinase n=1 Tax=Microbacterium nymphoidis TaxID=2898586 RepID=UPI001E41A2E9|nr:rhamnulokinase family protein [Microbacterium nymphoidis]MCD2497964.1 rhamnulokinase [Microbacterium nymphoidis]
MNAAETSRAVAVAAVDLGATSGRVIVGRIGADTLEMTAVARFPNGPVPLASGLHWDFTALLAHVLAGLRAALGEAPEIASIGIDSWAVDYALLRGERMLGEPFHYRDPRTADGVDRVHERMPHDELFLRNGLQFLPFTTLYQLATEDPAVLAIADHLLLIPDLLAFQLTGQRVSERTNASTTGLLNATTGDWDEEVLAALGLDRSLLAPLISPDETIGALREDVASTIGATARMHVTAVGSHDTASAVVAVPMDPSTAAYISCGTWGLVGVEVDSPVLTAEVRDARFTNEGGVDGRIRLLHNVMGLWLLSETVRAWERDGADIELPALLAEAAAVTEDVPVFDVDDPRFLAPGDMPARITAWFEERGIAAPDGRAALARSIIESLAQAFADTARTAARLGGVDLQTIHLVGGGTLNELLCQRTADRSGLPVLAGPVEATALGNILIQGRALGAISGDLQALRDLVARTHPPRRYDPAS